MSPRTVTAAAVAAGLREWTRSHDLHVRAAVWLLLAHETWPRRAEFRDACVRRAGDQFWIDWSAAREAFDAGEFDRASSTEIAVLDLVIALGQDRYRLRSMGEGNARLIAEAIVAAVGVTR
ncbi:MAG: hypothetical protein ACRDRK_16210 [Pseudonocardia sp.]